MKRESALVQPIITSLLAVGLFSCGAAFSHEGKVSVSIKDGKRCFTANGLPDHDIGTFPNKNNPHGIEEQKVNVCVNTHPTKSSIPKYHQGSIGIGINGVQFRPGTADYYDASTRRGHSRSPESGWKVEGLNPENILGMDENNAHVGPNGLYHYHGFANALNKSAKGGPLGYAADGFPIYYAGTKHKSSYQLKKGTRPSGPGGTYDGTYENDFSYVAGIGTLDECNGGLVDGKFAYFATETYPFLPRCMWGDISKDFENRERGEGRSQSTRQQSQNSNRQGNRTRPGIKACSSLTENADCSFYAPRREKTITGKCEKTPRDQLVCR